MLLYFVTFYNRKRELCLDSAVSSYQHVLVSISVKFLVSQNKMLDFSYLFKIGFLLFYWKPEFRRRERSVDARDNTRKHRPEKDDVLLNVQSDNSFAVCSSTNSNFLPFSHLPLRVKLNYQLRKPAADNSFFSLDLLVQTTEANCQEFVPPAELSVFLCHIVCSHCICAYLFFSLLSNPYVGGNV